MTAFRALAPDLPAALSTFGRLDQHDLDWTPWRNAGFHFLPQAYPNEDASLTVQLCNTGSAQALGNPRLDLAGRSHPTIGIYPGARGLVTAQDYVEQLAAEPRARGFSVYLAERMDPGAWAVYGEAIRAGRIVVGEPPEPEPEPRPREPEPQPEPQKPIRVTRTPAAAAAARLRMLEQARAVETAWLAQGQTPETIARSRIGVARAVLETSDATWRRIRDQLGELLAPPSPDPPASDT